MKNIHKYPFDHPPIPLRELRQRWPKILTALILTFGLLLLIFIRTDSTSLHLSKTQINISSASGEMITFRTQNGQDVADKPFQSREIPHLVLMRNAGLTDPRERSLVITVNELQVPATGATISLEVSTQHKTQGQGHEIRNHMLVWQETHWISGSANEQSIQFTKVFKGKTTINNQQFQTPTDYFQVDIRITDPDHPNADQSYQYHQDYAFLLENQWLVDLPSVMEDLPGAAPSELLLYYYDMLPFQIGGSEPGSNLPQEGITDFIKTELIPAMQATFVTESVEWEFPWHAEWRSYRPDEPPNRLSVALTDGSTWYHGQAQARGSGGISLRVDSKDNTNYWNSTDSMIGTFYHELFHNLQRSINLYHGGDGDVDGLQDAWQFFSEGTAVLATSAGQPEVQFSRTPGMPVYFIEANGFFAGGGDVERDLNRSYEEIDPYHAVIYWRFLYEKCGGLVQDKEYPAQGMQIIHNALSVLYSKKVVDIQSSSELVKHLPAIMDLAIQNTPACPFENYQESLLGFSSAIYLLQQENGRCFGLGSPTGCGLYDPVHRYLHLPIPGFEYSGDSLILDSTKHPNLNGIKNSYGMDFIDIDLAPETQPNSINIDLVYAVEAEAEFTIQVVKVNNMQSGISLFLENDEISIEEGKATRNPIIRQTVVIPKIELEESNQLGLIITRVDNQERNGSSGDYTITIY